MSPAKAYFFGNSLCIAKNTRLMLARMLAVLVALLGWLPMPALGQQNPSAGIRGTYDRGVVMPEPINATGRQDATAIAEIRLYRAAVGATSWSDMEGIGEITANAVDSRGEKSSRPATLWISGDGGYRLDIETPQGTRSVRIEGGYGAIEDANQHRKPIDVRNAANGLVSFPQLLSAAFLATGTELVDDGMATVDGVQLHRVSLQRPLPGNVLGANGKPAMTVTDFYFQPQTHLLVKSAGAIVGLDVTPARYLQVITYGDYRAVNGMQIPFQYQETIDGQLVWTLQLNQVSLNQGVSQTEFHF